MLLRAVVEVGTGSLLVYICRIEGHRFQIILSNMFPLEKVVSEVTPRRRSTRSVGPVV